MITPDQLKDITGFEKHLLDKGFTLSYCTNTYFNTYDSCNRTWTKDNSSITIGLCDSPTRVGIPLAPVVDEDNYLKYTFLPSTKDYDNYINILTYGKA